MRAVRWRQIQRCCWLPSAVHVAVLCWLLLRKWFFKPNAKRLPCGEHIDIVLCLFTFVLSLCVRADGAQQAALLRRVLARVQLASGVLLPQPAQLSTSVLLYAVSLSLCHTYTHTYTSLLCRVVGARQEHTIRAVLVCVHKITTARLAPKTAPHTHVRFVFFRFRFCFCVCVVHLMCVCVGPLHAVSDGGAQNISACLCNSGFGQTCNKGVCACTRKRMLFVRVCVFVCVFTVCRFVECILGFFKASAGNAACVQCAAGFYCSSTTQVRSFFACCVVCLLTCGMCSV